MIFQKTRELRAYKLYVSLNIVVVVFSFYLLFAIFGGNYQTIGNLIVLMLVLASFILYGKISFTKSTVSIFLIAIYLYLLRPGDFFIGVPLIPLLGLFLLPKEYNYDLFIKQYKNKAEIVSLITLFCVYLACYLSTRFFGGTLDNAISSTALFLIVLNLIFFKEVFYKTVVLAVVLSLLFTPGLGGSKDYSTLGIAYTHHGNRSGVFLLLFLVNKLHIQYMYSFLKRHVIVFFLGFCISLIILYFILEEFMVRPKMTNLYSDPRFQWFAPLAELFYKEGPVAFFDNGAQMLYELGNGRENPHNSFFYLLLAEYWVGLLKVIIFFGAIFVMPIFAWLALAGRASFDIFFMLGPINIIVVSMIVVYFKRATSNIVWKNSRKIQQ